jgi:hypothetical protein
LEHGPETGDVGWGRVSIKRKGKRDVRQELTGRVANRDITVIFRVAISFDISGCCFNVWGCDRAITCGIYD